MVLAAAANCLFISYFKAFFFLLFTNLLPSIFFSHRFSFAHPTSQNSPMAMRHVLTFPQCNRDKAFAILLTTNAQLASLHNTGLQDIEWVSCVLKWDLNCSFLLTPLLHRTTLVSKVTLTKQLSFKPSQVTRWLHTRWHCQVFWQRQGRQGWYWRKHVDDLEGLFRNPSEIPTCGTVQQLNSCRS